VSSNKKAAKYWRIGTFNCNGSVEEKLCLLLELMKKREIDVLFLQDTGIRTEGQENNIHRHCKSSQIHFLSKCIA